MSVDLLTGQPSVETFEEKPEVKVEPIEENGFSVKPTQGLDELQLENKLLRNELETVRAHNEALEDNNLDLRAQLAAKSQVEKDLQEQLKLLSQFAINSGSSHQKQVDLQRMYDQMCYKDNRIVELNNYIMEKERQIMDLQEMCRGQSQVAEAKNRAVQIVNKRLKDLDNRKFSDVATETDFTSIFKKEKVVKREISPGRAVPQLRLHGANSSPPPLDPSEEQSSYTTETVTNLDDGVDADREWSSSPTSSGRRKYRKKVTFDLRAASVPTLRTPQPGQTESFDQETLLDDRESLAQAVVDLSAENDQLRRTIAEMELSQGPVEKEDGKIAALEEEAELARKDARNQAIKARAAATYRIKELETTLLELRVHSSKEIENLKASNEVLKSSREWSLLENSKLLEQISQLKDKLFDLRGELDASNAATNVIRQRLEAEERRYQGLTEELRNAHAANQQLIDEKSYLANEVERLNDDFNQQVEIISAMEGDLIVYEAHVAILRESLSMTKKEEQQLIKSKAFAAKLSALEQEKAAISKRNSDEKIRTKALNAKIRELEKERDSLVESIMYTQGLLQQYEDSKGSGRRTMTNSIDGSECGEPKKLRKISEDMDDTQPRFHERAIMEAANQARSREVLAETSGNMEQSVHEEVDPDLFEKMVPEFARAAITPMVPTPIKFQPHSAFQPPASQASQRSLMQASRETLNSNCDLEARLQSLKAENESEKALRQQLVLELAALKESQNETIESLKQYMHLILEKLKHHENSNVTQHLINDLETYSHQPDGELSEVVSHVERFIDEVVDSLIYERTKEAKPTEMSRHIQTAVDATFESLRLQMEREKKFFETEWTTVKALILQKQAELRPSPTQSSSDVNTVVNQTELSFESEKYEEKEEEEEVEETEVEGEEEQQEQDEINKDAAKAEEIEKIERLEEELVGLRESQSRLQTRLNEADKKALEMIIEREDLQHRVQNLQTANLHLSAELERLRLTLNEEQRFKLELGHLLEQLRLDNDRFRIEAELSRNCLEDLRETTRWNGAVEEGPQPAPQVNLPAALNQDLQQDLQVDATAREALNVFHLNEQPPQAQQPHRFQPLPVDQPDESFLFGHQQQEAHNEVHLEHERQEDHEVLEHVELIQRQVEIVQASLELPEREEKESENKVGLEDNDLPQKGEGVEEERISETPEKEIDQWNVDVDENPNIVPHINLWSSENQQIEVSNDHEQPSATDPSYQFHPSPVEQPEEAMVEHEQEEAPNEVYLASEHERLEDYDSLDHVELVQGQVEIEQTSLEVLEEGKSLFEDNVEQNEDKEPDQQEGDETLEDNSNKQIKIEPDLTVGLNEEATSFDKEDSTQEETVESEKEEHVDEHTVEGVTDTVDESRIQGSEGISLVQESSETQIQTQPEDEWTWGQDPANPQRSDTSTLKAFSNETILESEDKPNPEVNELKEEDWGWDEGAGGTEEKEAQKPVESVEVKVEPLIQKEVKPKKSSKKLILGKPKKINRSDEVIEDSSISLQNIESIRPVSEVLVDEEPPSEAPKTEDYFSACSHREEIKPEEEWGWGDEEEQDEQEFSQTPQPPKQQDEWGWGEEEEVKPAKEKIVKKPHYEKKEEPPKKQLDWAWNDGADTSPPNQGDEAGDWEDW